MRELPPEMKEFGDNFHQDIFLDFPQGDDAIRNVVANLRPICRERVGTFLSEILSDGTSDDELNELWETINSEFFLSSPDQARGFFALIQSEIERFSSN